MGTSGVHTGKVVVGWCSVPVISRALVRSVLVWSGGPGVKQGHTLGISPGLAWAQCMLVVVVVGVVHSGSSGWVTGGHSLVNLGECCSQHCPVRLLDLWWLQLGVGKGQKAAQTKSGISVLLGLLPVALSKCGANANNGTSKHL